MAFSKHATMVFGLSLIACTASASIPDANGVIHGCYNVLTGSTRIIDGNSCGLLEKSVTWNQTGPRGPVGPQGPQGPQGPSGSNDIVVGSSEGYLNGPVAANTETYVYPLAAFKPAGDGTCNIQIHANLGAKAPGAYVIFSAQLANGAGNTTGYVSAPFVPFDSDLDNGSATNISVHLPVDSGQTYRFGVDLVTRDAPITPFNATTLKIDVTWTCTGGPNTAT